MANLWFDWIPLHILNRLKSQSPNTSLLDREEFLNSIEYLDLSSTNLAKIPEFISEMKNLKSVDLSGNHITGPLHGELFGDKVTSINLVRNYLIEVDLTTFSKEALSNLQSLRLDYNPLESVPVGLELAASLLELTMKGCKLKALDKDFKVATSVMKLDFSSNDISTVDIKRGALANCSEIDLSYNMLTSVPRVLYFERSLRSVNMVKNPLEEFDFLGRTKKGLEVKV